MHEPHDGEDAVVGHILHNSSDDALEKKAANAAANHQNAKNGANTFHRVDVVCDCHKVRFPGHVSERENAEYRHHGRIAV